MKRFLKSNELITLDSSSNNWISNTNDVLIPLDGYANTSVKFDKYRMYSRY